MNIKDMLNALLWAGVIVLIIDEIHNVLGDLRDLRDLRDEIRDLKRSVKKLEDKK